MLRALIVIRFAVRVRVFNCLILKLIERGLYLNNAQLIIIYAIYERFIIIFRMNKQKNCTVGF